MKIDPVRLTADLVRCPSVTPEEAGAIQLLETVLTSFGFVCHRISRGGVENLYARWGTQAPVFAFAGHTDVVPVGDRAAWTRDPFAGEGVDPLAGSGPGPPAAAKTSSPVCAPPSTRT